MMYDQGQIWQSSTTHDPPLPPEAHKRRVILTVAHVGDPEGVGRITEVLGRWVAYGDLEPKEWAEMEAVADRLMARKLNGNS